MSSCFPGCGWLWEGFLPCVAENSINVSNKKHGKVLRVCKYFSPETSNELLRIEDMILTKTTLFFYPSFLPRCKFCLYVKQSSEVFVVYILTSMADLPGYFFFFFLR